MDGEVLGSTDTPIAGVRALSAAGPGDLSFLVSAQYETDFRDTRATAVLVTPEAKNLPGPQCRIMVSNPREAAIKVLEALSERAPVEWGIHPSARIGRGTTWSGRIRIGGHAVIGANVSFGESCWVGSNTVIEDGVTVGDHSVISDNCRISGGTRLGRRVLIGPGSVIGKTGFGYLPEGHGYSHFPHAGACVLEDDVAVGANVTIDRGSFNDTVIGKGTKIDNLVHVAHNVSIGENCILLAQVGLAGTTQVGRGVILAGQAGVAGHLTIGDGARVAAQAGVIGDVEPGDTVSGYPARNHREVLRQAAALKRVTGLIRELERIVQDNG